ncbi:DMT family transporter [Nocardiopsis flavescens]
MRYAFVPLVIAAGLVVMWSSGFVGAELGTRYAPAETLLAWRFLAIAGPLAVWGLWIHTRARRAPVPEPAEAAGGTGRRTGRMTGRDAAGHAAVGALAQAGFLYGVYAASAAGAAAGTVALIAALQPLVATALAVPLLGERVRPRQAVGLALGLAGVALVVGADLRAPGATPWWAYALPVGAMLSLVAATLLERRLRPGGTAVQALAVQCGVSAVLFTALAAGTGTLAPPADPGFWAAVAWVVVLSTLGGYGLYWAALARFGVARVSALLYLTPPTTLLWSLLMFGDPVGAGALAGMAVCAAAVALVAGGRGPAGPRPARLRRVPAPAGRRGPRDPAPR